MTFKRAALLILILQISFNSNAQLDSISSISNPKQGKFLKSIILPISFITVGSFLSGSTFEKNFNKDLRNAVGNDYEFRIDDYVQYAPIIEMYAADALGIKSKNHWFDQTKNLFISNLASSTITFFLKKTTGKLRPNGRGTQSFPSGHTTFAFTNATVLYNEFKDTSPILAYSGYAFASTTGAFRMLNNKHWVSDVLVGAGIGILVTKLVYHFEPLKNWNPFKDKKGISFVPIIDRNQYGLYAQFTF
jgi:hypothetical protein